MDSDVEPRSALTPIAVRPAVIKQCNDSAYHPFLARPLLGALLFTNETSDARDHCANERTFLSYLRLSVYLAVVGIAIILSFHLKSKPSALELRVALPLGIVFWILSLALLGAGVSNYVLTVTRYGQRRALVQTGWKTQMVLGVVSVTIVGCCGLFLGVERVGRDS